MQDYSALQPSTGRYRNVNQYRVCSEVIHTGILNPFVTDAVTLCEIEFFKEFSGLALACTLGNFVSLPTKDNICNRSLS